jgi:hypothetical protein
VDAELLLEGLNLIPESLWYILVPHCFNMGAKWGYLGAEGGYPGAVDGHHEAVVTHNGAV